MFQGQTAQTILATDKELRYPTFSSDTIQDLI